MTGIQQTTELLTADAVEAYLRRHPDFFAGRDELLLRLRIPHKRGSAISLVERQMTLQREKIRESDSKLDRLMRIARDNDRLFGKTRRLMLALLAAEDLMQLQDALVECLLRDFELDQCRLLLLEEGLDCGLPVLSDAERETLAPMLEAGSAICGKLSDAERAVLFGDQSTLGSAAIAPLESSRIKGLIALGSRNPDRFQDGFGTLFLDYIAEAVGVLLDKQLKPSVE
ncbi:DUF484 family protein [Endozoicomonadaceae bacterium StTr2]